MSKIHTRCGFTLIDIMVTIAVMSIIMAGAVPALINVADGMKLGNGQRDIYQEMQTARLVSVASNRPIRIRFNCPVAGQYRLTELIGSPAAPDVNDSANDRCSATKWTFPANDNDPTSRPNHDGPVRLLPTNVTFGASPTLEFWPDGTVHKQTTAENPWDKVAVDAVGIQVSVVRGANSKLIRVNGLGKIQFVQ